MIEGDGCSRTYLYEWRRIVLCSPEIKTDLITIKSDIKFCWFAASFLSFRGEVARLDLIASALFEGIREVLFAVFKLFYDCILIEIHDRILVASDIDQFIKFGRSFVSFVVVERIDLQLTLRKLGFEYSKVEGKPCVGVFII